MRFHRAQMRAASETAPDSSVFEHQTPSSSDQHHSYNGGSVSSRAGRLSVDKSSNLLPSSFSSIEWVTVSRYTYGSNEYTSSGPGTGGSSYYNHQAMTNYELSADYVDSTTAYDPRPTPTQVDVVAPDTPSVVATGVLPNIVTNGECRVSTPNRSDQFSSRVHLDVYTEKIIRHRFVQPLSCRFNHRIN